MSITPISKLLVAWLNTVTPVTALTSTRISTTLQLDPTNEAADFPQIVCGYASRQPSTATSAKSRREEWIVPIYCVGGRRSNDTDDLPNMIAAWALADVVTSAMAALESAPYVGTVGTVALANANAVTPNVMAGNYARVTISARVFVWRAS